VTSAIVDFFRCPEWFGDTELRVRLRDDLASKLETAWSHDPFWRELQGRWFSASNIHEMIDGLRREHYQQAATDTALGAIAVREAYYLIRPLLPVPIRRHLQKFALRGWDERPFPRWPIDRSVDELHEVILAAAMKHKRVQRAPFIWFWPKGCSSCLMMTHDVEQKAGLRFCSTLMDMDDSVGIKSSFQLVPEQRYKVSEKDLDLIRSRGFEVNVHDLNHDGHLFRDREKFRRRVRRINEYGRKFGASGFRAGALYRNQDWYESFEFAYDMSVPNVAHLDPQHGGCCTIFPYFLGKILEMPVTAIQDYSLFHVLGSYSIDMWRTQMSEIVAHHGLVNVITHPDYLIEKRARQTYKELLQYMSDLRANESAWIATPREVNDWWRQRSKMKLVWQGEGWSITGEGSERAAIAHAELGEDGLAYSVEDHSFEAALHSNAALHNEPTFPRTDCEEIG
jgi:hypothetical protein